MKSIIFLAFLAIGIASCETPQPATGTTDDSTTSGTTGSGTGSGTTGSGSTGTGTGTGSRTDTTTTKKDSLPR